MSVKPPTQWQVGQPVPVAQMEQLREIPRELPLGWINQFLYLSMLYDKIRDVPGDVVECGLGEGNTFAMLAFFIGDEDEGRILHGFDSFEGWPEPDPSDASPRNPKKGEWGPDDRGVTEEAVQKRLVGSGIFQMFSHIDVRMTKGFLEESLPHFPDRPIAFVHLDVDLYEGYRDGLHYLYPLVSEGGVIAFDEYREFHPEDPNYIIDGHPVAKWPGCDRAIDEFFKGKGEVFRYHAPTQKYYIIKGSK